MAAAEVLAYGTTAANSTDITVAVADARPTRVCLKGSAEGVPPGELAQVVIEAEDEDGFFWPIGSITGTGPLSMVLEAQGIYRATRVAANPNGLPNATAKYGCGVFTG